MLKLGHLQIYNFLFLIPEHLLAERLTVVPELHSHLEPMSRIALDEMDEQISFSYIKYNGVANVISLPGPFSKEVDSTRYVPQVKYSTYYRPRHLPAVFHGGKSDQDNEQVWSNFNGSSN